MDRGIASYQQAIKQVLSQYKEQVTTYTTVLLLFDDDRGQYMAVRTGWRQHQHIHLCLVHMQIRNSTIIIHSNNTEDEVASELVELGVPGEQILLGFLPPGHQEYIELPAHRHELQPA